MILINSKFYNKKMKKLKCILIGEGKVGKTSLINQYINNQFEDGNYTMTTSGDKYIKEIKINDKIRNIEIWDTPGQAVYATANKIFMKNTDIALIVYDITEKKTFDKLNDWINLVKEVNPNGNFIIGIAANKSDLYEEAQVTNEEGKEYIKTIKDNTSLFFETSATDHENVEDVFNQLTKAYIDKYDEENKPVINSITNDQNEGMSQQEFFETNNVEKINVIDKRSCCDKSFKKCSIF